MADNKSIKCTVDECVYNDPENSYCTLDDIQVSYDQELDAEAICASYESIDDFDEDDDDENTDDQENE